LTDQPPIPPHADPAYDQAELPPREPMFRIPLVTGWLILLNVLVHVARQFLPEAQDNLVVENLAFETYAPFDGWGLASLLTYQFLHANWLHLVVNMTSLLAFGSGLERVLHGYRFVLLYLACGIAGALFEAATVTAADGEVLIGASASISGIFGALIILLGLNRLGRKPVNLALMIALVLGSTIVAGVFNVGSGGLPVAWRAHVGGFGFGLLAGWGIREYYRRRLSRGQ
jgi:membrane associated rhomboid family serine protease